MTLGTCPTVVLCLGPSAVSIGEHVASSLGARRLPCPPVVWAVSPEEAGFRVAPIPSDRSMSAGVSSRITGVMSADELADILVADALMVGDPVVAEAMERSVALRLSIVVAIDDARPSDISTFAKGFQSVGPRHAGARYVSEAYLLLPDFRRRQSNGGAEHLEPVLDAVDGLTLCWWLGCINAIGLTMPATSESATELAAVVATALIVPPDMLQMWDAPPVRGPLHASAGCAEWALPAKELVTCLTKRHTARLLGELFLQGRGDVDGAAVRRRVWDFALSDNCEGAVDRIEETPGGERVWNGFHPPIPEVIRRGEIHGFLDEMRTASVHFEEVLIAEHRLKFEHSARHRLDQIRAAIEQELGALVQGPGGLFSSLAFLDELVKFLVNTKDVREGERASNIQELRRERDRVLASALHVTPTTSDKASAKVHEVRQRLTELKRLRDVVRPPAMPSEWFNGVAVGSESLHRRIEAVTRELEVAEREWAQASVDSEAETQQLLATGYPSERARRLDAIRRAEERLCEHADRCWVLYRRYEAMPALGARDRFGFRGRRRKALNDELTQAQENVIDAARQVRAAYAARMQLSIDRELHEIRDRLLRDLIDFVRERHAGIAGGSAHLDRLHAELREASLAPPNRILRRSVATSRDIPALEEQLTGGSYPSPLDGMSPLEACSLQPEAIVERVRDHVERMYGRVLELGVEQTLQLLRPEVARLDAIVTWMKHASHVWLPPSTGVFLDSTIVCVSENSGFGGMLRSVLPGATFIDEPDTPIVSILRIRRVPELDTAHLVSHRVAQPSSAHA